MQYLEGRSPNPNLSHGESTHNTLTLSMVISIVIGIFYSRPADTAYSLDAGVEHWTHRPKSYLLNCRLAWYFLNNNVIGRVLELCALNARFLLRKLYRQLPTSREPLESPQIYRSQLEWFRFVLRNIEL